SALLYSTLANSGKLGLEAQQHYESQVAAGNLILGGRSEILVSSRAVADSPFLGHGSWARDREYSSLWVLLMRERGVKVAVVRGAEDIIPTHSYLLGSWVEHGMFGALFWFVAIIYCTLALVRPKNQYARRSALFF